MATVTASNKSIMQRIWEDLPNCVPTPNGNKPLADALAELFREYAVDYDKEWKRINDNAAMYRGDHWAGMTDTSGTTANAPKPSTPIITSTIENLKADLSEDFPTAVIEPDIVLDGLDITAKVLTRAIWQDLDACGWAAEYDSFTLDLLVDGWAPLEIGYDPDMDNFGGTYIRHVSNKNWMCDPQTPNVQDGRAIFKFERMPRDWFYQRYPDFAQFIGGDSDLLSEDHDEYGNTMIPNKRQFVRLIEAWIRMYDAEAGKYRVHFVLMAGGQILFNSAEEKPDGFYEHGKYPFVVGRLYKLKGNPLGFGIVDLFKEANRYSDKMEQIILLNAYRASRPRLMVQRDAVDSMDEITDYANEVIAVNGNPQTVAQWQATQPLPSHVFAYMADLRNMIKQESGANDMTRGQAGGGVTATGAITALQEMATKRSRMEGRSIHSAFQEAIRMLIETMRGCDMKEREIGITYNGVKKAYPFSSLGLKAWMEKGVPVERFVTIRTARQTQYSMIQHNNVWLEMMKTLASSGAPVDPMQMLEGLQMEGNEKELLLENLSRAQKAGLIAAQQRAAMAEQQLAAEQQKTERYRASLSQSDSLLARSQAAE